MKDKKTEKKRKKREQKKADRAKTLIGSQQTCPHHISVQPALKEPSGGQRAGNRRENPLKWSAAGNYRNRRRKGIDVARW